VTNTNDETVDVSVDKEWVGPAAGDVLIRLAADGIPTGATMILNEGNDYEGSFTGLDKYNDVDGALIVYTITEDAIPDYSTVITGDADEGFVVTNTNDETVDISVDKEWIGLPRAKSPSGCSLTARIPERPLCSTKATTTADHLRISTSITMSTAN